ncbi:MAG TPA: hypothetical protein VJ742_00735 [Nitrososphaera sp.]|nr:hypothetical protein [Nitrososphaera sp.]
MTRSIFLPDESFHDVQDAINKAKDDDDLKRIINDRLRKNGWTRDKEIAFRDNAKACGFILGSYRAKESDLAKDSNGRSNARLLADAVRHDIRNSKIEQD